MLRYLILAAAVSSGGAAAWLTVDGGRTPEMTKPVVETPIAMTDVLVAAADIVEGGRLSAEKLRWQPWPEASVKDDFITRTASPNAMSDLEGSLVRRPLRETDPIIEAKLAPKSSGYMSALLPAGKRAVAVKVSAESSAGGFVLPNDRVDVIHTITRSVGDVGASTESRVILNNVRVLAVDQSQMDGNDDAAQKSVIGQTATLELDIAQVRTITAAQATGSLTLALRSIADVAEATPLLTPEDPASAAVGTRKRKQLVVTVTRNGKPETVEVKRHTRVSGQRIN
ncbi:Flp pilus assembly protein CpaB [Fulvimarina sp. MAC3]|uniref:Flp pilus assembly protein CpaB n=1 Tax=Fulvimarina sp. MAC3 TaxID=3148887 RepID=UPI0031FE28CE